MQLKEMFLLTKPSVLTKVLYFDDFKTKKMANLTPLQIDMVNCILYIVKERLFTNNNIFNSDFLSKDLPYEIDLSTISSLLNKYNNGYYEPILMSLVDLSRMQLVIEKKINQRVNYTIFNFIRKINWDKTSNVVQKRVKVWFEPELIDMLIGDDAVQINSFYLSMQIKLKSKYSKLLYELLKEVGDKYRFNYTSLLKYLNISESIPIRLFKRDYLKRSISEINDKTDLIVDYKIHKPYNKLLESIIEFNITHKSRDNVIEKDVGGYVENAVKPIEESSDILF